jgi:tellurite methyltransferase
MSGGNERVPRDWNRYYADPANFDLRPEPLLVQVAEMLPPGRALDLACGAGRNALYLARLGWHVAAVDSSPAALATLREQAHGLPIDAHLADLEHGEFPIPPDSYHLICDILYLQRSLFPAIREGVVPGGLFAAVLLLGEDGGFRLQPGELRREFEAWKILYCSESAADRRARPAARIIARKG